MKNNVFQNKLVKIQLPPDGYVIFGGACLAVRGLRETNDIDLFVSPEVYKQFKARGWEEQTEPWMHPWLKTKIDDMEVEMYQNFDAEGWQPRFERYLMDAEIIDGYRFMPLDELFEWKAAVRRPKDIVDMKLIDEYRKREANDGV